MPPTVLPPPLADKPVLVKKDSKRKLARAAASRSSAAERPLKNGPSLAKEKHKIDYAPMQSSMNTIRVRERQRRLADRPQKPRQVHSGILTWFLQNLFLELKTFIGISNIGRVFASCVQGVHCRSISHSFSRETS